MRKDHEERLERLVARALDHHDREERAVTATTDNLQEYREREADLRAQEFVARTELRDIRERIDHAHNVDVDNLAKALAAGEAQPRATAQKLQARMIDLERRVLPGFDEALVLFAEEVRCALADGDELLILRQQTPRWKAVPRQRDPGRVLAEPRGDRKPDDIVSWIVQRLDLIRRDQARRDAEAEAKERKEDAYKRVCAAQDEHNAQERRRVTEEEDRTPSLRQANARKLAAGQDLWPPFDRLRFLQQEGLEEAYGYIDPSKRFVPKSPGERHLGGGFTRLGGREQEVIQVPAEELQPASTEA
jgi:hypothetical protein